jgi:hypothetical protein
MYFLKLRPPPNCPFSYELNNALIILHASPPSWSSHISMAPSVRDPRLPHMSLLGNTSYPNHSKI